MMQVEVLSVIGETVQEIHVMKRRSRIESWCMPPFETQKDKGKPWILTLVETLAAQILSPLQAELPRAWIWSMAPNEILVLLYNILCASLTKVTAFTPK